METVQLEQHVEMSCKGTESDKCEEPRVGLCDQSPEHEKAQERDESKGLQELDRAELGEPWEGFYFVF